MMMTTSDPDWEIKLMGHATAEYKGPKTPHSLGMLLEWIKREKWRGCLEINFPGNGGVNQWIFRESPKRIVEEPELPYER